MKRTDSYSYAGASFASSLAFLTLLYLIQELPYGFFVTALPLFLREAA